MEIIEFCNKVKDKMEEMAGPKVSVEVSAITKNNGILLNCIIVTREGRMISPNIYLDDLYKEYESGRPFEEIIQNIFEIYRGSGVKKEFDMEFFTRYDNLKKNVAYKLISRKKNEELLEKIPYIEYLDMAIVFYCRVPDEKLSNATILIYNNHLEMWNISKDKLYEDAKKNIEKMLPALIQPIEEIMKEIFVKDMGQESDEDDEQDWEQDSECEADEEWFDQVYKQEFQSGEEDKIEGRMFVLGNEKKLFGAATILYEGILEEFSKSVSKDIFILPSSVHEMILVPDDNDQDAEKLWRMVCEINETQVEPEDVLSDSLYYFSRKAHKVEQIY